MTDEVPAYLGMMDIFVLPSYREGFPRSILEAMSCGLPVVASNIRGCREAVVEGVTGYIVPPRDEGALQIAVEFLLGDPGRRKQMGAQGRRLVTEKYDYRNVREQFVAFIQSEVGDGGEASPGTGLHPQSLSSLPEDG
jgi:glycosyltransferase involved in cell wall biosynthesis